MRQADVARSQEVGRVESMPGNRLEELRTRHPERTGSELVAELVGELVAELGLAPPIDPVPIASHVGFGGVEVVDGLPYSSGIDVRDGVPVIQLRAGESPQRHRFTTSHEIVHALLGQPGVSGEPLRCDPVAMPARNDDLEALCDSGAVDLLVPRGRLADDLRGMPFGMPTVVDVWNRYGVGLEPLMAQIARSAIEPIVVLRLDARAGSDAAPGELLEVQWARSSGGLAEIREGQALAPGHALYGVLETGEVHTIGELPGLLPQSSGPWEISAQLHAYTDVTGTEYRRVLAVARPARS